MQPRRRSVKKKAKELTGSSTVSAVAEHTAKGGVALEASYILFTTESVQEAIPQLWNVMRDAASTSYIPNFESIFKTKFDFLRKIANMQFPVPAVWAATGTLSLFSTIANMLFIDIPSEVAKHWSQNVMPDGFVKGVTDYCKAAFGNGVNGVVIYLLPGLGMPIAFSIGSYGDFAALQQFLSRHFGVGQFLFLAGVVTYGDAYYTFTQAEGTIKALKQKMGVGNDCKARADHPALAKMLAHLYSKWTLKEIEAQLQEDFTKSDFNSFHIKKLAEALLNLGDNIFSKKLKQNLLQNVRSADLAKLCLSLSKEDVIAVIDSANKTKTAMKGIDFAKLAPLIDSVEGGDLSEKISALVDEQKQACLNAIFNKLNKDELPELVKSNDALFVAVVDTLNYKDCARVLFNTRSYSQQNSKEEESVKEVSPEQTLENIFLSFPLKTLRNLQPLDFVKQLEEKCPEALDQLNETDHHNYSKLMLPPRTSLLGRAFKNDVATTVQGSIEIIVAFLLRDISFGFLGALGVLQLGYNVEDIQKVDPSQQDTAAYLETCLKIIGFIAANVYAPGRWLKGYDKFLGSPDKNGRLDLVTAAQRAQEYAKTYGQMSWPQFIGKEAIRLFLSFGAMAEVALAAYSASWLIQQFDDEYVGIRYGVSLVLSMFFHWNVYRQAYVNMELNEAVVKKTPSLQAPQEKRKTEAEVNNQKTEQANTGPSLTAKVVSRVSAAFEQVIRTFNGTLFTNGVVTFMAPASKAWYSFFGNIAIARNGYDFFQGGLEENITNWQQPIKDWTQWISAKGYEFVVTGYGPAAVITSVSFVVSAWESIPTPIQAILLGASTVATSEIGAAFRNVLSQYKTVAGLAANGRHPEKTPDQYNNSSDVLFGVTKEAGRLTAKIVAGASMAVALYYTLQNNWVDAVINDLPVSNVIHDDLEKGALIAFAGFAGSKLGDVIYSKKFPHHEINSDDDRAHEYKYLSLSSKIGQKAILVVEGTIGVGLLEVVLNHFGQSLMSDPIVAAGLLFAAYNVSELWKDHIAYAGDLPEHQVYGYDYRAKENKNSSDDEEESETFLKKQDENDTDEIVIPVQNEQSGIIKRSFLFFAREVLPRGASIGTALYVATVAANEVESSYERDTMEMKLLKIGGALAAGVGSNYFFGKLEKGAEVVLSGLYNGCIGLYKSYQAKKPANKELQQSTTKYTRLNQ